MSAKLPHGWPVLGMLLPWFVLAGCDANPYDPPEIREARQLAALPLDTPVVAGARIGARVRATDIRARPVAGVVVHWQVVGAGGGVAPATSVTDLDGIAHTTWTLDTATVTQRMRAATDTLAPAEFVVTPRAAATERLRWTAP